MAKKGEIARKGKSSCIIISAGYSVVGHYNFLASVSLFVVNPIFMEHKWQY